MEDRSERQGVIRPRYAGIVESNGCHAFFRGKSPVGSITPEN